MFNNHTLSVINNLEILGQRIYDKDRLAVAAITTSDYPKLENIYNAAILVPPTEILMAWADGDPLVMQNAYPRYLCTETPDGMIVALLGLLTQKDVCLYIPADEFNVFGQFLLNHIYYFYGIICNTPSTNFAMDQTKVPFLLSKFYMIDIMDANNYLEAYPANAQLPDFVINKLANELHPFANGATFAEYANYFNSLNMSKASGRVNVNMVEVVKNDNLHG